MKTCNRCLVSKSYSEFSKKCDTKDGVTTRCKSCLSELRKADYAKRGKLLRARHAVWYAENKDAYNERRKGAYDKAAHSQKCREYYKLNKAKVRKMNDEWAKQNPEKVRQAWKNYAKRNPAIKLAQAARRRASKRRAYAAWDRELTNFVVREAAFLAKQRESVFGFRWHVDHAIPLAGKNVSGLHVWNNFQVIPAAENWAKFNKFEVSV